MSFTSYAQNFEDVRLWRAFSDVECGRYLDIGSQDPVLDSVSLAFYQLGWRGIHVDASPTYAEAMRNARPDETVIMAAVSTTPGSLHFWNIDDTGLSTGCADIAARHAQAGWPCREIIVPTISLAEIFEQMGTDQVHWMKIDVEGMESDVLASWGAHPTRPQVLVIEATAPLTQDRTDAKWRDLVASRGYRDVLFDGLSRYFVHESCVNRAEHLALSPNIFDDINITSTHFMARALVAENVAALDSAEREVTTLRQEAHALAEARDQAKLEAAAFKGQIESDAVAHAAWVADLKATHSDTLEKVASALEARATAGENALSDVRRALEAKEEKLAATLLELGLLQGRIEAQQQAHQTELAQAIEQQADLKHEIGQLGDALDVSDRQIAVLEAALAAANDQAISHSGRLQAEVDRFKDQIDWREAQLWRAVELLNASPKTIPGWPGRLALRLAKLTGRSVDEHLLAHAKAVDEWKASLLFDQGEGVVEAHEAMRAVNVTDLLARDGAEFIRSAYKTVLEREPDSEGARHYLSRLRSGWPKLSVLMEMRDSGEGRRVAAVLPGLDAAILRYRLAKSPVLGPIYRLLTGATGSNARERQICAIANVVSSVPTEIADLNNRFAELSAQLAALVEEIRAQRAERD
ncbi:FkbM family methyltransferase [Sphingobium sp. YBL2]|uniref:FkbM family methyltransferase n=1 Tax=Sphingobium sp. (strain YBL2) TaxID=484429 RepID=UPI0006981C81|nr:FkbM family methyltransferase [Sphingobium sp. YBL2]